MAAAPMEAEAAQPPSNPSFAAAAYPRWVMLEPDIKIQAEGSSSPTTSGDSKTLAAARTSTGHLIQVSLCLAEPPGVSRVCLHIPHGLDVTEPMVLAAHGDSVLVEIQHGFTTIDHFVYSAGAAAAEPPRPPSMHLLPPFRLHGRPAGLVRRGEDLVVLGALESVPAAAGPVVTPEELARVYDLHLFRSGEWSIKRLQIRFRDVSEVPEELPVSWDAVVAAGDGLLCWVYEWHLGVVLCDGVFEETPRLQYVPLPVENIWGPTSNRSVCAAGSGALKFVNVFPRCCCGGAGASCCERSCHAYTIETWTMARMGNGEMGWVKDAMVDATELWALDAYKGLQRFPLDHPVVSLDEPEVICLWLHEPPVDGYWRYSNYTVDVLMINTRSKTIHSVSRYEDGLAQRGIRDGLIPSKVSYFFNSHRSERPPQTVVIVDDDEQLIREDVVDGSNPTTDFGSFAEPSVQASEIFEAFQEIPSYGLDHDELKVYRILSRDNCRRFRSLLRLPKNLRKDWLLMEIKASED